MRKMDIEFQYQDFFQELTYAYEKADSLRLLAAELDFSLLKLRKLLCKLRLNGTPVPLLRNGYSIFNGTKYR
jgi:biotin operon repressor